MENRLVYFATQAEQQESAEISKTEKTPDGLQKTAEDLAQLEKLRAKPGGTKAASEARSLLENSNVTEFAKKLLQQKITAVEAAAANRKSGEVTPQKTETLDKKVDALKKVVENQKKELADKAIANSKFERLATLSNANEIFQDVKISINSKSKGGAVEFKWGSIEGFKKLNLEQKNKMLEAMDKKLNNKSPESAKGVMAMRDKLLNDSDVPKSWKDWLKNPEKGWAGGSQEQKNADYVVDWVNKNLGALIIQTEKFKQIVNQAGSSPKAAEQLSQKGVTCSLEKFRESSRTDRNEILKSYSEVLAGADATLAKQAAEAGVSDGTEAENIQTKNTAAIERQAAEAEKSATGLVAGLKKFSQDQKLEKAFDAKKTELGQQSKDSETVDDVANLRARAQNGNKINWLKKILGKKEMVADDKPDAEINSTQKEIEEAQKNEGKEFDADVLARKQVVAEKMGDVKISDEYKKALGVREGISAEDLNKLSALAMLQKTDVDSVKTALTPELKKILETQAVDKVA